MDVPPNGWYGKSQLEMDDWGVPIFQETSMSFVFSLLQRCFSLTTAQDLTLAMVPAEGVAADLSHLNMKCKVS